jgi:hypothetical protein
MHAVGFTQETKSLSLGGESVVLPCYLFAQKDLIAIKWQASQRFEQSRGEDFDPPKRFSLEEHRPWKRTLTNPTLGLIHVYFQRKTR